jgi:hypothetical protein
MNQVTEQGNSENTQLDKIHANYPDTIFNKVNQKKLMRKLLGYLEKKLNSLFIKLVRGM